MIKILKYFCKNMQKQQYKYKFYDVAANLTDDSFFGIYHEKKVHQSDIDQVIKRAADIGCDRLLIAAGYTSDAYKSYELCKKSDKFYATIGVHPCRANYATNKQKYHNVQAYFEELEACLIKILPKVVAIGECGLDYDRLNYSSKQEQLQVFPHHFRLAEKYKLPLYLHNRNTGQDFYDLIKKYRSTFSTGVVHSFTGTAQQLKQIIELDLYVGINGCSMKTQQNLEVLKQVPIDRIMFETDSPYCEIRNSHASSHLVKTKFQWKAKQKHSMQTLVKSRNEPCTIIQILEVAASVMGLDPSELAQRAYENSVKILSR